MQATLDLVASEERNNSTLYYSLLLSLNVHVSLSLSLSPIAHVSKFYNWYGGAEHKGSEVRYEGQHDL